MRELCLISTSFSGKKPLEGLNFPQSDMLVIMISKTYDLLTELKMRAHFSVAKAWEE